MVTVSALATTLFLGGWRAPWPISLWEGANEGWWPLLWWLLKVQVFIFIFIWLRGTLPRLRYDQFMQFGWKFLIPVSIAWIMVVAVMRALRDDVTLSNAQLIAGGVVLVLVLLGVSWALQRRADARAAVEEERQRVPAFEARPAGFPVPPLPGQQAVLPTRRAQAGATIVQEKPMLEEGTDA